MSETCVLRDDQRIVVIGGAMKSPASWEDVKAGRSGIRNIDDTHLAMTADFSTTQARVFGVVDYHPLEDPLIVDGIRKVDQGDWHRSHLMAWKVMHDALESAGLNTIDTKRDRIGALIGSTFSGNSHMTDVDFTRIRRGDGFQNLFARVATAGADKVNIHNLVAQIGTECASSGTAAVMGAILLSRYRPDVPPLADIMLVGGADAPISPKNVDLFIGSMKGAGTKTDDPEQASKPLDESADGLVVSEGAAVLALTSLENAKVRGLSEKDIWAELVGYAAGSDAESNTLAGIDGSTRVIRDALKMGGVTLEETVYANVHGTGTPSGDSDHPGGDRREINAWKLAISALELSVKDFWLSPTKAYTGHTMGASAAIEAIYSIMALKEGIIPPRIKLYSPIEETDGFQLGSKYDSPVYLPNIDVAVTTNFGFTGTASALVFRKFRE